MIGTSAECSMRVGDNPTYDANEVKENHCGSSGELSTMYTMKSIDSGATSKKTIIQTPSTKEPTFLT